MWLLHRLCDRADACSCTPAIKSVHLLNCNGRCTLGHTSVIHHTHSSKRTAKSFQIHSRQSQWLNLLNRLTTATWPYSLPVAIFCIQALLVKRSQHKSSTAAVLTARIEHRRKSTNIGTSNGKTAARATVQDCCARLFCPSFHYPRRQAHLHLSVYAFSLQLCARQAGQQAMVQWYNASV